MSHGTPSAKHLLQVIGYRAKCYKIRPFANGQHKALIALGSINQHVNKHAVASLTWIMYDIIICIGPEVELIWKARWTIPKVLYIALRYCGVIWLVYQFIFHVIPGDKLSDPSCGSFPTSQVIGVFFLWFLVDMILLLRIRALYQGKTSIIYLAYCAWIVGACIAAPVALYCSRLNRTIPAPFPLSMVAGCIVPNVDVKRLLIITVVVVTYILLNSLYLGLSLYKFFQNLKGMRTYRVDTLFTILVGDGVVYYVGCVFLNIMSLLFTGVVPSLFPYLDVVQFWLCAFYSYGGCHLILHLRSANNSLWSLTSFVDCADMGVIYVKPPMEEGTDLGQMTRS